MRLHTPPSPSPLPAALPLPLKGARSLEIEMVAHSGLITVMTRAARKAAPRLRRDFGEVEQLQVSKKGPADFVSMADKRAEQTIIDELRNARPDWGLVVEEAGVIEGNPDKPRWIVDPLDGTTNFLHGLPHFAISIAVEDKTPAGKPEITHGLVYQPITDESFWAEKGRGAWLADRRLRVSGRRYLDEALIGTGMPHFGRGNTADWSRIYGAIAPEVCGVRRMGSRSEEHTSELQSRLHLVCRLPLERKTVVRA